MSLPKHTVEPPPLRLEPIGHLLPLLQVALIDLIDGEDGGGVGEVGAEGAGGAGGRRAVVRLRGVLVDGVGTVGTGVGEWVTVSAWFSFDFFVEMWDGGC